MALAPLLAGCVTSGDLGKYGATIAFESIDGPPRPVFERLVARLDAEAQARRIVVVSRRMPARYRVRAYLAAAVTRRGTTITWVCDVYDADLQRVARIVGEEKARRNPPDAWAAVDDRILDRIADAAMMQLADLAGGAAPAERHPPGPEAPPPEPTDPPAETIRVAATPTTTGLGDVLR